MKSRSLAAAPALVTARIALAPSTAFAGPDEACAAAANDSEVLRRDVTRLTKARDELRVCAANECPSAVREECRKALDELESTISTVKTVVQPRQRNIEVRAKFQRLGATTSHGSSTMKVSGLALAWRLGAFFGPTAAHEQSTAHCPDNKCTQPNSDREALVEAKDAGNLSTAFFIAGGVLTAGGLTMFFPSPAGAPSPGGAGTKSARVRPSFGPTGVAVVLEGMTF